MASESEKRVVLQANTLISIKDRMQMVRTYTWVEGGWLPLLTAAPAALEMLAQCRLVASTDIARSTTLTPPARGWTYLSGHKYLNGHLAEVTNEGDKAFTAATNGMNKIQINSKAAMNEIAAIFRLLLAVPFNKITVQNRLQSVTRMAATCQSAAEDMESAFVRWGEFIKELHASCESEEGHAMHLFGNAKSDIEAKEIIKTSREEMLKEQKAKVTEMETKVDENHKMFMKLLKDFPSGDQLLKDQIKLMWSELGTQVVKMGVAGIIGAKNPMAGLAAAKEGFGSKDDKDSSSKETTDTTKPTTRASADAKEAVEEDMSALRHCPDVVKATEAIDDILKGKDGVRWALVTGTKEEGTEGKLNLRMIKTLLEGSEEFIKGTPTENTSTVGKQMLQGISRSLEVVKELAEEGAKEKDLKAWKKPAKDSKEVKGWQIKVDGALASLRKLKAMSATAGLQIPGASLLPQSETEGARIQARSDLNRSRVEAATSQLKISLEGLQSVMKAAQNMQSEALNIQERLIQVRKEIKELENKKITLEKIRDVLRSCILYLSEMQTHTRKLVMFFGRVKNLVNLMNTSALEPFERLVAQAGEREKQQLAWECLIGEIFNYAVDSATYFDFNIDLAQIYLEIDTEYLQPGIELVHKMGGADSHLPLEEKKKKLLEYATGAEKGINEKVAKRTKAVVDAFQARATKIHGLLGDPKLPRLLPSQQTAITDGANIGTEKVQKQIQAGHEGLKVLALSAKERNRVKEALAETVDLSSQLQRNENFNFGIKVTREELDNHLSWGY